MEAAQPICKACLCRDRAHDAVERFCGLLTSVPDLATANCTEDGDIQINPLPIGGDFHPAHGHDTWMLAMDMLDEMKQIAHQCADRVTPGRDCFSAPQRVFRERIADRAFLAAECPGLVRRVVAGTLLQVPDVVVNIVLSYIDVVCDFVDMPFVKNTYGDYVRACRMFVEDQRAALRATESSKEAHRAAFDAERDDIISNVLLVATLARHLTWNHANGNRLKSVGRELEGFQADLTRIRLCFHSVEQANASRVSMTQRWAEVEAQNERIKQLGFPAYERRF